MEKEMEEILDAAIKNAPRIAHLYKELYRYLMMEEFTSEQAMEIIKNLKT